MSRPFPRKKKRGVNFVSGGLFSLMGSAVLCAACPSLPMALLTQVEMCHLSSLPHFWGFWIRVLYNTGSWELKVFWFLLSNPRAFISFVINTWCPKWWVRVDFFFNKMFVVFWVFSYFMGRLGPSLGDFSFKGETSWLFTQRTTNYVQ